MTAKTKPSYNPKVPCECGRGTKSKNAISCKLCGRERYEATIQARRDSAHANKHREPVSNSIDAGMAKDWLRKPLRVSV